MTPELRLKWLLGIARAVGAAADCTRRQVGAVIYDPMSYHILSTGYNGLASGLPGCGSAGACPRGRLSYDDVAPRSTYTEGPGRCEAIHAEDNALRRARERGLEVAGMHVVITDAPCEPCVGLMRHYDIAKATWPGAE